MPKQIQTTDETMGTAVTQIATALEHYGEAYRRRYNCAIENDGIMSGHFEEIARGTLGLLNGDLGSFSAGELDRLIRRICQRNGFKDFA